jgi:hypothetical protein
MVIFLLFLLKKITSLLVKIILVKKVCYLVWDSIILLLPLSLFIKSKELLNNISILNKKVIKTTLKSNSLGAKNTKPSGSQVKTNTISKFHQTASSTSSDRNQGT